MARTLGFEPRTGPLTAGCSTTKLCANVRLSGVGNRSFRINTSNDKTCSSKKFDDAFKGNDHFLSEGWRCFKWKFFSKEFIQKFFCEFFAREISNMFKVESNMNYRRGSLLQFKTSWYRGTNIKNFNRWFSLRCESLVVYEMLRIRELILNKDSKTKKIRISPST